MSIAVAPDCFCEAVPQSKRKWKSSPRSSTTRRALGEVPPSSSRSKFLPTRTPSASTISDSARSRKRASASSHPQLPWPSPGLEPSDVHVRGRAVATRRPSGVADAAAVDGERIFERVEGAALLRGHEDPTEFGCQLPDVPAGDSALSEFRCAQVGTDPATIDVGLAAQCGAQRASQRGLVHPLLVKPCIDEPADESDLLPLVRNDQESRASVGHVPIGCLPAAVRPKKWFRNSIDIPVHTVFQASIATSR